MVATITMEQLQSKLQRRDEFTLLEVLPFEDYRLAHLPGALPMPLDLVDKLAPEMLPDKGAEVVVYCKGYTCQAAEMAARELAALGYTNVLRYAGGKQEWTEAGLSIMQGGA
jgi:rhodanese-related sulfurtransferase